MKKFATMITVASLALPLALAAPLAVTSALPTANAATTKTTAMKATTKTTPTTTKKTASKTTTATKGVTYTLAKNGVKNFKAVSYHIKANTNVYKGFFYADAAKVTFTKKGVLKGAVTYKVTRSVKVTTTGNKTKTFFYVTGQGYVAASAMTKGPYQQAD